MLDLKDHSTWREPKGTRKVLVLSKSDDGKMQNDLATATQFEACTLCFDANLRRPLLSKEERGSAGPGPSEMQVVLLSGVLCWRGRILEKPVIQN